jgi:histidine triad (HIT) family protein
MKKCVFCQVASGELPSRKVYEDAEILAFEDVHPSAPVHVLVIPKEHIIANLGEATPLHRDILAKIQLVAPVIAKKLKLDDFSYRTNTGKLAGQSVWHLHYHLQGGWKGGEN